MNNPLDLVLSRLPKPARKAPARAGVARAFRAGCPACEGHGMPLSLAETQDGWLLLHCFAGCSVGEVLAALGLSWDDVLPQQATAHMVKSNGGPTAWGALAAAVDGLRHCHARLLGAAQVGDAEQQMRAFLDAGEAMQKVQQMARRAMREGGKS